MRLKSPGKGMLAVCAFLVTATAAAGYARYAPARFNPFKPQAAMCQNACSRADLWGVSIYMKPDAAIAALEGQGFAYSGREGNRMNFQPPAAHPEWGAVEVYVRPTDSIVNGVRCTTVSTRGIMPQSLKKVMGMYGRPQAASKTYLEYPCMRVWFTESGEPCRAEIGVPEPVSVSLETRQ